MNAVVLDLLCHRPSLSLSGTLLSCLLLGRSHTAARVLATGYSDSSMLLLLLLGPSAAPGMPASLSICLFLGHSPPT